MHQGQGAIAVKTPDPGLTLKNPDGGSADPLIAMCDAESRLRETGLIISWAGQPPEGFESLRVDSRLVQEGDLFCAIEGTSHDGHLFLDSVAESGAAAAIVDREVDGKLPMLRVSDSRTALAHLASFVSGDPASGLTVVGVTGTNGKTTTTLILRHLLGAVGDACALGTLGLFMPDGSHRPRGRMTTPGPIDLMADFTAIAESGATHVAMEVSSHALDQRRVDALDFSVGVFTNLTREHLDYHPDMTSYRDAKLRFVDLLGDGATAVVNADDPTWDAPAFQGVDRLSFGFSADADIRATDVEYSVDGSRWILKTPRGDAEVTLPLLGDFNVANALGAAGAVYALGADAETIAGRLASAPQVPGRMEVLSRGPGPLVLRDYAHTPDGLERALDALRALTTHRLTVVFGCGGDRDRGKRGLMGATAISCADRVIVTIDNPRSEDPDRIFDDITGKLPAGAFEIIEDRETAVEAAVLAAGAGDVVLLAGKGHETYQDIRGEKVPFDEASIVHRLTGDRP